MLKQGLENEISNSKKAMSESTQLSASTATKLADAEKALVDESSAFLAADLVLESNSLIEPRLSAKAREMELQTSSMMTFVSMGRF